MPPASTGHSFRAAWLGGSPGHDFVDPNYEAANAAIAAGSRPPSRAADGDRAGQSPSLGWRPGELEQCLEGYGFRGLLLDNEAEGFCTRICDC